MTAVTTNSNNKQEGEDVNILINIFSRLHHMTARASEDDRPRENELTNL